MARRGRKQEEPVELKEVPSDAVDRALEPRDIVIDQRATDVVDAHAGSDVRVEKGGVLVGTVDEVSGRLSIVAAVPATRAVGEAASLTFTHDAWDEVNEVVQEKYPNERIVGWYHSHPRFGIFLSDYDTFIHSNFFGAAWQVAYVVDPVAGEAGLFGWEKGRIARLASWLVLARGSARVAPEPKPEESTGDSTVGANSRPTGYWTGTVAAAVVSLVLGVLLGSSVLGARGSEAPPAVEFGALSSSQVSDDLGIRRAWAKVGDELRISAIVTNRTSDRIFNGIISACLPSLETDDPDSERSGSSTLPGSGPPTTPAGPSSTAGSLPTVDSGPESTGAASERETGATGPAPGSGFRSPGEACNVGALAPGESRPNGLGPVRVIAGVPVTDLSSTDIEVFLNPRVRALSPTAVGEWFPLPQPSESPSSVPTTAPSGSVPGVSESTTTTSVSDESGGDAR